MNKARDLHPLRLTVPTDGLGGLEEVLDLRHACLCGVGSASLSTAPSVARLVTATRRITVPSSGAWPRPREQGVMEEQKLLACPPHSDPDRVRWSFCQRARKCGARSRKMGKAHLHRGPSHRRGCSGAPWPPRRLRIVSTTPAIRKRGQASPIRARTVFLKLARMFRLNSTVCFSARQSAPPPTISAAARTMLLLVEFFDAVASFLVLTELRLVLLRIKL